MQRTSCALHHFAGYICRPPLFSLVIVCPPAKCNGMESEAILFSHSFFFTFSGSCRVHLSRALSIFPFSSLSLNCAHIVCDWCTRFFCMYHALLCTIRLKFCAHFLFNFVISRSFVALFTSNRKSRLFLFSHFNKNDAVHFDRILSHLN